MSFDNGDIKMALGVQLLLQFKAMRKKPYPMLVAGRSQSSALMENLYQILPSDRGDLALDSPSTNNRNSCQALSTCCFQAQQDPQQDSESNLQMADVTDGETEVWRGCSLT